MIKLLIILIKLTSTLCWIHDAKVIDADLIENNILPVNYFFVQFNNVYGLNITHLTAVDQNLFQFSIKSNKCKRISSEKIYTGDGLFIIRFKVFEKCHNIEIDLKFRGRNLKNSPLCIKSIYPENCNCPRNLKKIQNSMKCGATYEQIKEDLKPFEKINFTELKTYAKKNFQDSRHSSVCNYVIKENKVFRKCYGKYVGFKMFMDSILLSLTRKAILPDVEFFINLGDWPLIKKSAKNGEKFPMFSWCGSQETFDIVIPTYDLTESTLNMQYRVVLDILSVQKEKYHWNDKINKAFFRGRDSRRERLDLVTLAKQFPQLFNSSITNFFFYTDEIDTYGPKSSHISFFDFFEYKYQINVDGTVAAYRFPYLLAGNSAVLKQDSQYYEHFYRHLKPFVHYIPFNRDPKIDLVEKVKWLKENENEAKKITKASTQFVRDNLLPRNTFCYFFSVLEKFADKIVSKIEVDNDMELVSDDKNIECSCKNL
ncbi:hypothetical protein PVAND_004665 [Polypedilum vanderplanki]|uniref:Glycosyl transferase CAP10 domain-containing protein n=1 Tax=Polypedilum vanderplanki TaxID=319348 RepID=A0A9J6BXM9_POLVA|nr:hypothetical protein PVAND_004665 [Polypedilum vanderplanki]